MPTKERRARDKIKMGGHHVTGPREGWRADRNAVGLLLRALGYPDIPPVVAPKAQARIFTTEDDHET